MFALYETQSRIYHSRGTESPYVVGTCKQRDERTIQSNHSQTGVEPKLKQSYLLVYAYRNQARATGPPLTGMEPRVGEEDDDRSYPQCACHILPDESFQKHLEQCRVLFGR